MAAASRSAMSAVRTCSVNVGFGDSVVVPLVEVKESACRMKAQRIRLCHHASLLDSKPNAVVAPVRAGGACTSAYGVVAEVVAAAAAAVESRASG
jgi:hypothetical protein